MKSVIVKPLFTEKTNNILSLQNKYAFVVTKAANKIQISQEITKKFNVTVTNVHTVSVHGKTKTMFRKSGRFTGKTAAFKKAIITLKQGDKIDLFEQA